MSSDLKLDLSGYRTPGTRVYAGRERGAMVRQASNIAEFERTENATLHVVVPSDTKAISSSFFLALFGDTVRLLRAAEFRRRVKFEGRDLSRSVEQGIAEALAAEQPLSFA